MRWTLERYHELIEAGHLGPEDRVELLYGQLIPMSPTGRFHAATVSKISKFFFSSFSDAYTCRGQDPVAMLPDSEPEPDFVVARFDEDDYAAGHPTGQDVILLIEVSDSSLEKDRSYKLPLYAASGIREYWIVNLVERQFEVYTVPSEEGEYSQVAVYGDGAQFEHPVFGRIDTAALMARVVQRRGAAEE